MISLSVDHLGKKFMEEDGAKRQQIASLITSVKAEITGSVRWSDLMNYGRPAPRP